MSTDLTPAFIDFILPENVVKKLLEIDESSMLIASGRIIDKPRDITIGRISMIIDLSNQEKVEETITREFKIVIRTQFGDISVIMKEP